MTSSNHTYYLSISQQHYQYMDWHDLWIVCTFTISYIITSSEDYHMDVRSLVVNYIDNELNTNWANNLFEGRTSFKTLIKVHKNNLKNGEIWDWQLFTAGASADLKKVKS